MGVTFKCFWPHPETFGPGETKMPLPFKRDFLILTSFNYSSSEVCDSNRTDPRYKYPFLYEFNSLKLVCLSAT